MYVIEKLVCLVMSKLLKLFNINDIDKCTEITYKTIGITGFLIETFIVFYIGYYADQMYNTLLFFLLFGALRLGNAEHYDSTSKCLAGTTLIYTFLVVMWQNFNYLPFTFKTLIINNSHINFSLYATDILWTIGISLYFRKWDNSSDN